MKSFPYPSIRRGSQLRPTRCADRRPYVQPGAMFPQSYTYGYTVQTCVPAPGRYDPCPAKLPNGQAMLVTSEGGNIDLRVPYIGYGAESEAMLPKESRLTTLCKRTSKSGSATACLRRFLYLLSLPGQQSAMGLLQRQQSSGYP